MARELLEPPIEEGLHIRRAERISQLLQPLRIGAPTEDNADGATSAPHSVTRPVCLSGKG
jgi:hypothetical protein